MRLTPRGWRIVERIARAHGEEFERLLDHMGEELVQERKGLQSPARLRRGPI